MSTLGLIPIPTGRVTQDVLESTCHSEQPDPVHEFAMQPTGRVLTETEHQIIADFAIEHDMIVFTDEMYEKIMYDGHKHYSLAGWPGMWERTITFNGFSKAYAMTGWRMGYMAGPKVFINEIAKVQSHSITHATSFAMAGAVAALAGPQDSINDMVAAWDGGGDLSLMA